VATVNIVFKMNYNHISGMLEDKLKSIAH